MKSTFIEVIDFLQNKSKYMVIGSFALNLHQKFPYSDDFDISLGDKKQIESWVKYFISRGWKITKNQMKLADIKIPILTLEKHCTTLDLIFDPQILRRYKTITKKIGSKKIMIIDLEAMLIRKLAAAFNHPERGTKRISDFHGAITIFKKAKKQKLINLFKKIYF